MRYFDSLVHVTADGSWLGTNRFDASLPRLLKEMDRALVERACLVAIADYADNDSVIQSYLAHPDRFVPVGSINPAVFNSSSEMGKALDELVEGGFLGLKLHSRLNRYHPLDERCLTAIEAAGERGLVVFLDTLFRQDGQPVGSAADIVDRVALACRSTKIILLHGGASEMLSLFELVRMHDHLILDLSFTILRYAGSSLDKDMRFVCQNLDQRVTVGSDFPEYAPAQAFGRLAEICDGLPEDKLERILFGNLEALFPSV